MNAEAAVTTRTNPMFRGIRLTAALIAIGGLSLSFPANAVLLFGPDPYASTADSPFFDPAQFDFSGGYLHLETFDDHLLNEPVVGAVTASSGFAYAFTGAFGSTIDQVGLPGGCPDPVPPVAFGGLTVPCDTWFYAPNAPAPALSFVFNAALLGGQLPNAVGIVFTDGLDLATDQTFFEAFDGLGVSLGVIGPVSIADAFSNGTVGDDNFFGVFNDVGVISRIDILHTAGSLEVDHLQFGFGIQQVNGAPEPGSLALLGLGLAGLWLTRRRTLIFRGASAACPAPGSRPALRDIGIGGWGIMRVTAHNA